MAYRGVYGVKLIRNAARLNVWMDALRERHPDVFEHSLRAAILTRRLLVGLRASDEDVVTGTVGAYAHDIGKLFVPREIIVKAGAHDAAERKIMRTHVTLGESLVESIDRAVSSVVGAHHERFDGCGYPRRVTGISLSLVQRAVTIVDSFVAMTEDRPYQVALSGDGAREELLACAGSQFCPETVKTFIDLSYAIPTQAELALVDRTLERLGLQPSAVKWSEREPQMFARMECWTGPSLPGANLSGVDVNVIAIQA